jgi:glycosyltransferase involved in cell wall biosynthesis
VINKNVIEKNGEKMRILFIRSNPVDPDSRVEKEVNSLINVGHEVEILAWDRSANHIIKEGEIDLENGKVKIYRIGIQASFGGGFRKNLRPLLLFQLYLIKWLVINSKRYDVIHACDFDTAYTSSIVSKFLRKKIIYDIFDYYVDSFGVPGKIKRFIENKDLKVINNAEKVIICSEKRIEQLHGNNAKEIVVIHNTPAKSLDFKQYKKLNSITLQKSRKIKIVYVGILVNGRLISEIAQVISKRDDCEYHVAGFGPLAEQMKSMSLKIPNIYYYGKISYKETLDLENQCDIMTAIYDPQIPNHKYAAPNKFYESLMLGKPIIVVKNTGIDEIILTESIGEVMDYYNENSFDEALTRLIDRKFEWPEITKKGKSMYLEKYSWDIMEKRLIDLYKGI